MSILTMFLQNTSRFYYVIAAMLYVSALVSQETGPATGVTTNATVDSLQELLKKDKMDTNRVIHLNELSKEFIKIGLYKESKECNSSVLQLARTLNYKKGIALDYHNMGSNYLFQGNYSDALKSYSASLEVDKQIGDKKSIADSHNNIGVVYLQQGNYKVALEHYSISFEIRKELGDKGGLADSYVNYGIIYHYQGNDTEALRNYFMALKLQEQIHDKEGMACSYESIGTIYAAQHNYPEALRNYVLSLKIDEGIGRKYGIADSHNNIGNIYSYQADYEKALTQYLLVLKIREELSDLKGISDAYLNMGSVYSVQGKWDKALENYFFSLKQYEEIGDRQGIALCYLSIGQTYISLNKLQESKKYLNNALQLSKEIEYKDAVKNTYHELTKLDSIQSNWKDAYNHHKLFIAYSDSLDNDEVRQKTMQMAMTYEFEKKEAVTKALQDKKDAIAKENSRRQNLIIWSVSIVLVLIVVFSGFIYNRYRVINRQSKIIEEQQRKLEAQKEHEKIVLEQKLLRSQMNPHFIYNSLGIIHEYIQTDKAEIAGDYLIKFSKLMRLILENSRLDYVPLEKEIETLNLYLKIHELGFKNGFDYDIFVSDDLDPELIAIPPMLAQPFIENAIKHGIANSKVRGDLKIRFVKSAAGILFSVKDNGIGYSQSQSLKQQKNETHMSLAIRIVQERLAIISRNSHHKMEVRISDCLNDKNEVVGTHVEFEIPVQYLA